MAEPIYIEVDASVVDDGMMTLNTSEGGGDPGTAGSFWLYWDPAAGFTGGILPWSSLREYIDTTGWPNYSKTLEGYDASYDSFVAFLATNPTQLNDVLSDAVWTSKQDFLETNWMKLTENLGYPGYPDYGCIGVGPSVG